MSRMPPLTDAEATLLDRLVAEYTAEKRDHLRAFLHGLEEQLSTWRSLSPYIHSMKWRVKEPEHLRAKLTRKLQDAGAKGSPYGITIENLFARITDLAGFRVLHLHTRQMGEIDRALREIFDEYRYPLLEGPFARTWDDESRRYFSEIGIEVRDSPSSLYTSVHYVIEASSRTKYTCEIQVRTLAEELFGEVDHRINYPTRTDSIACKEQLLVLARVTSSCSRLVDAIFHTFVEERTRVQREEPLWRKILTQLKKVTG